MFNFYFDFYNEYTFTLLFFNIITYIFMLINLFLIFFIFDIKYFKTLNELKFFGNLPFLYLYVVILFLSFAGIPPFIGFLGKFLTFIYFFSKHNLLIFLFFIFSNFFIIYFYLQNLRFLISKNLSNKLLLKHNKIHFNNNYIFYLNLLNFFNISSILYFEDFLIFLNFLSSNFYI